MKHNKTKIILVNPQMGENIGAAARIMSNFGLENLTIVKPKEQWPNEKAIAMAASGAYILDKCKLVSTFPEALDDTDFIIATTATTRDINKTVIIPQDLAKACSKHRDISIIFGCEKSGLTNEHLSYADLILNIPTATNHSLNLAQAVAVVSYELSKANDLEPISLIETDIAPKQDLYNMLDHLYKVLEEKDYYKNPKMQPNMEFNLRNLFTKSQLNEQEIRTLRGIISLLEKGY